MLATFPTTSYEQLESICLTSEEESMPFKCLHSMSHTHSYFRCLILWFARTLGDLDSNNCSNCISNMHMKEKCFCKQSVKYRRNWNPYKAESLAYLCVLLLPESHLMAQQSASVAALQTDLISEATADRGVIYKINV